MQRLTLRIVLGGLMLLGAAGADAQAVRGSTATLLQRASCGAELPADQVLLFGAIRAADLTPRAGIRVAALWTEAVITREGAQTLLRASVDTTAADGTYALCGLPRETRLIVRADAGDETDENDATERSGELSLDLGNEAAVERDLVVGPAAPSAVVTGRLVGEGGNPVRGEIEIPGNEAATVSTDASGAFRISGVPRRSTQLRIRAIGYVPFYVDVTPDGPLVELGDVEMPTRVQELNRVLIAEKFMPEQLKRFEERRASLNGIFLDSAYLARFAWRSANNVRMASPSVRGSSGRDGDVFRLRRGVDECFPIVFVNGVNAGRQGPAPGSRVPGGMPANEMTGLLQRAKRIEFYLAQYAPPEFADFEGCGAMVIWLD